MSNKYLKVFDVTLTTIAPIFIGSGKEISKKGYLFLPIEKKAYIMDEGKLYSEVKKRGYASDYERFISNPGDKRDLMTWFKDVRLDYRSFSSAVLYKLDCGDRLEFSNKSALQLLEFMKDPYNMPYIPGTSLKGMLRTILLAARVKNNANYQQAISRGADTPNSRKKYMAQEINSIEADTPNNRKKYMVQEINSIEADIFRTLDRNDEKRPIKKSDAVNDVLQGFIVSDSKPLSCDDLVLCQKLDKNTRNEEMALPVCRECIKPDTKIKFTITIDTSVCKYDKEAILNAISEFNDIYYENFASKYKVDRAKDNTVYLGGGVGFLSKTVIYSILSGKRGIETTIKIFKNTLGENFFIHKHNYDMRLGVSPHILKCTRYKGKLYEMGKCLFEMKEIEI